MTRFKPVTRNGRYGMHYVFEHNGECIPMHKHADAAFTHNVMCLQGYVHVFGPNISQIVVPGQEIKFDSTKDHGIEALEDGTEIINYYVHGQPPSYADIPIEKLSGTCQFTRTQQYQ